LCTNKPQGAAVGLLRALGLDGYFAAVIGGDLAPRRKPDPAHLAAVLEHLDTSPAAAAMVGDSRNDVLIAHGLGLPCILVSFGYTAVPARDLGGEAVIDRLAELPEALAALERARLDSARTRA
jgi:phosphoglycolate phosphatase